MLERQLNSLWRHIDRGDIAGLKDQILCLAAKKLNAKQKLRLATIANDISFGQIAYRLLYRQVGAKGRVSEASGQELLQYGRALLSLNLLTEAFEVFKAVNADENPMVNFALARLHAKQWDYAAMVPYLRAGLAHPRSNGRRRLLNLMLLANATFMANNEREEPRLLLAEVLAEARAKNYWDVELQATEIVLAHHVADKEWDLARSWLAGYENLFRDQADGAQTLALEKWRLVLEMNTAPDKAPAHAGMKELVKLCRSTGNYSQARTCEYYLAASTRDRTLLTRLYFGTPFPCFRDRLLKEFGLSEQDLPPFHDFLLGERGGASPIVVEAISGKNSHTSECLKPGQGMQRLLHALITDYYVPASIYELSARINPSEHFNPSTGPSRVWQLLLRLREWLIANNIPLTIDEQGGRYELRAEGPLVIRVHAPWADRPLEDQLPVEFRLHLALLRSHFQDQHFMAADVARLTEVSRSTTLNVMRALIAAGLAGRSGSGAQTRYHLQQRKGA